MPQNVLVSVLGDGKYLTALVRAILEKNIIPTKFLFLSAKNEASVQAAAGYDVTVCDDDLVFKLLRCLISFELLS